MVFCYVLGPYLGGYVARKETPNPHPKPDFVDKDARTHRLRKLGAHHRRLTLKKNQIPKRKKKEESAQQKSDHQLATNIKRRNDAKKKHRKRLILPKGLKQQQCPENLAFLASLDSDETRSEIPAIMKELGYSLSEIREYFDWRRDETTMRGMQQKFNEEAWKGLTMTFMTIYGIWVMSNEPFFSDPSLLFKEWPQIESWRVFLYYQLACGYHAHRAVWQFWDKKRSDFIAMFIHHWVTVVLVGASWYWGIMNIGAVVMVAHDNSDIFLPIAKCSRWLQWNTLKNVAFATFVCSWILSRICMFSWKVIIPVFMYAPTAYSCHYGKFVGFASLLLLLLILHLYWTYAIIGVAVQWICCGNSLEDSRSDDEANEEIVILPEEFSSDETDTEIAIDGEQGVQTGGDGNTFKAE